MSESSYWYLENIDLTPYMCSKKMGAHVDGGSHIKFKKGEYIYMPDQSSDKIFFLFNGRIKIGSYSSNGKEITKGILESGQIFGELSLIGETVRRDFAYCMEDTELCSATTKEMVGMMKDHNLLSLLMMRIMGNRVLDMESRLESLVFKDSRTRIIDFLVDLTEKKGQRVGYEHVVRKFLTHQEIANITATSRQSVTTVLNDLRSMELITFDRKRLLIRDLDALKKEAEQ